MLFTFYSIKISNLEDNYLLNDCRTLFNQVDSKSLKIEQFKSSKR